MEQILIDYLANATWQIPLLAGGAWLFIRLGKFGPRTQHCIWLAVLALAVGLPLRGVRPGHSRGTQTACTDCNTDASPMAGREALPRVAIVTQFVVADPRLAEEFFTLPRLTLRLSPVATASLVGIYFAILLFGLSRIVMSWRRARQLVMNADPAVLLPQWNAMFVDSGRRLGARLPQLRTSADVRSPVIVGVVHPVLLLPEDFDNHSQDEVQAALFHELAHVRRHDYLSNLLCQLAALPVAWHPMTCGVQQRIRGTREMICDDIAARAMQSEIGYAKCLLAMAGRTLSQNGLVDAAQATGLFGDNVLEERIMRLMQENTPTKTHAKLARVVSGTAAMIIAIAIAVSFHVTPTLAQTAGAAVTAPAPAAPPTSPAPDMLVPPPPPAPPASNGSATPAPPPPPPAPGDMVHGVASVAPIPPLAPEPAEAKSSHPKVNAAHPHPKILKHESFVIDSKGHHALTPEQKARFNKDMAAMNEQIADVTKHLNSPEFKEQMAEIAKQQADLKHLDFAQMQRQIDAATAKINSPEFRQQMKSLQRQMASRDWQRSMEEASKQLKVAEQQQENAIQRLDLSKVQEQIDAATAKISSPEFKQKMDDLQKQIESGAMERSMEEASKQLKAAEDQTRQVQTK